MLEHERGVPQPPLSGRTIDSMWTCLLGPITNVPCLKFNIVDHKTRYLGLSKFVFLFCL